MQLSLASVLFFSKNKQHRRDRLLAAPEVLVPWLVWAALIESYCLKADGERGRPGT